MGPLRAILLLAVSALALASCHAPPVDPKENLTAATTIADGAAPKGWTTVLSADRSVSIALPPGWKTVALPRDRFERTLEKNPLTKHANGFRKAAETAIEQKMFKLMFSLKTPGAYFPIGTVICTPTESSQEEVTYQNMQALSRAGGEVKRDRVILKNGPWNELNYVMTTKIHHQLVDHWCFIRIWHGVAEFVSFAVPQGNPAKNLVIPMLETFESRN